ncbi:NAD(P)H-hydrate dehydratase [Thalassovita aquimarina]|uniref:Bifunctional NAD(P)H-hydrate repair enzyme n=1 Tax=Thalassovita aquimarina TaxID=2785917 RepID=A0ABS5HS23_9RHOB|nr:NAD(P)H-hydrate dehydratase [Thalassovita aquimarina]MBR9651762.1 NAD(P)H-hydrate dehydratase [Thalassovita aquimarina]
MTELLTSAQMRAIERAAIESGEVTGLELMERAGRGVVEAIFEEWPELAGTDADSGAGGVDRLAEEGGVAPRPAASPQDICEQKKFRAVVLCGPGNNGGDGFVVARLLKERGWEVEVFLYGDPEKLPPDALENYERWVGNRSIHKWDDNLIEDTLDECEHDLVVDAVFGTGLTRLMPDDTERTWHGFVPRVFSWHQKDRPKYVAVDIPSGICSDSGRNLEGAFPTDLTVSFHRAKIGHYLLPKGPPQGGAVWCGKVVVKDIGLKASYVAGAVRLCDPTKSTLTKFSDTHKYSHGHALILSGGPGRTGAARMAARGALRVGAGLVTLAVPPAAQAEVAAQVTAIMLRRVGDATALAKVLEDARFNAIGLGPALGLDEEAAALVATALEAGRATVLDADALTLLTQDAALFAKLHQNCVLTPHAGEFKRLFPDIAAKLEAAPLKGPAYSKVDATREAAKRAGCVVLFKGPDTVIAAPDGRCSINSAQYERAATWLATAGSGDVLTGFIAGLLARGFDPMQAAETAAWLHVECALEFGPGLIAEDLPEQLPNVLKRLLSRP